MGPPETSYCGEDVNSPRCSCTQHHLGYQRFIASISAISQWIIERYRRHPRLMHLVFGKKLRCRAIAVYCVGIYLAGASIPVSVAENHAESKTANSPQRNSVQMGLPYLKRLDPGF